MAFNGLLKEKSDKILFVLSLIVIFSFILILNRLYPLLGEDWDYSFICTPTNDSGDRVSGLKDIFLSQYNHYLFWGGRSVTHAIAQFLLMIGERWHDILNSMVFLLSVCLVYRMVNQGYRLNVWMFWIIALCVWLFVPDIISTTLWLTYSANYLWGTAILIAFIYPYYSYYMTGKSSDSFFQIPLLFLGGIVAGWTNENMSLALIFFLISLLFLLRYHKEKIPVWMFFGLAGAIIGCVLLLAAPGNYVRLGSSSLTDSLSMSILTERFYNIAKVSIYYLWALMSTYAVALVFLIRKKDSEESHKVLFISLLFFVSAVVSIVVMLASPEFPIRVLSGTTFFLIIAVGIPYVHITQSKEQIKWLNPLLVLILLFMAVPDYIGKYHYTQYLNQFWKEREIYVEEQIEKGILDVEVTGNIKSNDKFIVYDLEYTPDKWINKVYARYYGLNTIRKISE